MGVPFPSPFHDIVVLVFLWELLGFINLMPLGINKVSFLCGPNNLVKHIIMALDVFFYVSLFYLS